MGTKITERFNFFCFVLLMLCYFTTDAQHDSLNTKEKIVLTPVDPKTVNPFVSDSAITSNRQKFVADSIATAWLTPDSLRGNQLMENMSKTDLYRLLSLSAPDVKRNRLVPAGHARNTRTTWIIAVVAGLLLYTGLLNVFLGNDLRNVLKSFYNKNALSPIDKESGLINSWAFLGLFLLFCLTFGLVLFQLSQYYNLAFGIDGFQLFLTLSAAISFLLALKFIILKLLGFVFQIGQVISEYIAVLNLTYFNMAFVFLGVTICFCLLANRFIPILLICAIGLAGIIFVWQYLRNSLNIISDFRFQKFYLFVYLCALEICPVLILMKALNI
jgi:hypothetical protein